MATHAIWLVTSLSVAAAIGLSKARSEQHPPLATSPVYAAMLADSRCSGAGMAGAPGRDLVVVRDLVEPSRQWWWNAFPPSDFPKQIPNWLPGIRSDTLQSFLGLSAPDSLVDLSVGNGPAFAWINRADIERLSTQGAFGRSSTDSIRRPAGTSNFPASGGLAIDDRRLVIAVARAGLCRAAAFLSCCATMMNAGARFDGDRCGSRSRAA